MSISSSMNNALSGLTANARRAEVVSSNLANALTDGYGRRIVDTSSVNIGGKGAGVQVDGVRRIVDKVTMADRRLADADLGGKQRQADALNRLEEVFGAADDPAGLGGRIAALERALVAAGSDPASEQRLGVVLTRLGEVTSTLNGTAREIQTMRARADADIATDVKTLNATLLQVESLNKDINRSRLTGGDSTALEDARQVAIDKISGIVPVRILDRDNGAVALMTTSGEIMLDGPAAQYSFTQTPTIVADMTYAGGTLSGIFRDGDPMSVTDGFGKLGGGSLGASFALRDATLVAAQEATDTIAADLISRFADPAVDPTLSPGDPGLLTDAGGAYDPLDLVGLSSRIDVNAAVDPGRGGLLSNLRDGVGAVAPGPVGDSAQITRWSSALSDVRSASAGLPALSASGLVARAATQIGSDRVLADESLSFAAARWDRLNAAELAGGVDTDIELQNLLQIEQAYAANARLIQTAEAMMRTLMEL